RAVLAVGEVEVVPAVEEQAGDQQPARQDGDQVIPPRRPHRRVRAGCPPRSAAHCPVPLAGAAASSTPSTRAAPWPSRYTDRRPPCRRSSARSTSRACEPTTCVTGSPVAAPTPRGRLRRSQRLTCRGIVETATSSYVSKWIASMTAARGSG